MGGDAKRLFEATGMPDAEWWRVLWPDPDRVIADLGIQPGLSVIDIGCGDGYFLAAIARRIAPARVLGIDLDEALLAVARKACAGLRNCDFRLGDAMMLRALIAAPVDCAVIANALHGAREPTALASEVGGVLKDDGLLAIINWQDKPREETVVLGKPRGPRSDLRMGPETARAVIEPAGFRMAAVVEFPPYHYGAIFRKRAISG